MGLNLSFNNPEHGIFDVIAGSNQPEYIEEIIGFISDYADQKGCTSVSTLGCCPQLMSSYQAAGFAQVGDLAHFIWQG
ncbi:MAG: hypothetical protein KF798_03615 [Candidatus Paracaedibacteraceae bacterium]|nr:hypothetical protein [Candidatus Paracaedibacteraceae bacterium]